MARIRAHRFATAAVLLGSVSLTACTGTNLGGGLAAAGLDASSFSSQSKASPGAGETTVALASEPVATARTPIPASSIPEASKSAANDAAETVEPDSSTRSPNPVVASASSDSSGSDTAVATVAATPTPPLPIAGTPDVAAKAPVLAMAPTKPERPRTLSLFRSRDERASLRPRAERQAAVRSARLERGREAAARAERSVTIIKPRKSSAALPGVRSRSSLFQIGRAKPNEAARNFRVASAAGLARLSTNGFRTQTARVQTECFVPRLVNTLRYVENHFGKPVTVTSGFRSAKGNRRAGGAKGSKHITCEAADFQVDGVSKWELAKFLRSLPGRGGVGTYCHTDSVHYDVGSERDWNWGCRKRR